MVSRVFARRAWIIFWVCLAGFVAACVGSNSSLATDQKNSITPSLSAGTPGGLQFMVSGDQALLQAYQSLVDLYKQRHANRPVVLVGIPGEVDFQKRLAAAIAAGRPPDVIVESYTSVPGLASRGLLSPLASDLAASRVLK